MLCAMRLLGVVGLVAVLGTGCGPIEYVNQVTRKASSAVDSARTAEADRLSPYYYTRAVEYLHKARVEAASADFQAANRFGRRAQEAAQLAKQEAIEHKGKPVEEFYPGFKAQTPARESEPPKPQTIAPLGDDDDGENPLGSKKP
jgi:uncharacterized protein DUF4398